MVGVVRNTERLRGINGHSRERLRQKNIRELMWSTGDEWVSLFICYYFPSSIIFNDGNLRKTCGIWSLEAKQTNLYIYGGEWCKYDVHM